MSRAIASARQRRAGISSSDPPPVPAQQQSLQSPNGGLTLPQVISVVDSRLIKLEKFMKECQSQQNEKIVNTELIQNEQVINSSLIDEFQSRFDLLAQELMDLKNIVLKLQTYTMDVNKQLLEEKELILDVNKQLLDERELLTQSEEIFNIQTVEEELQEQTGSDELPHH